MLLCQSYGCNIATHNTAVIFLFLYFVHLYLSSVDSVEFFLFTDLPAPISRGFLTKRGREQRADPSVPFDQQVATVRPNATAALALKIDVTVGRRYQRTLSVSRKWQINPKLM